VTVHQAFELECEARSVQELRFFRVHGYWPEMAAISERKERSFTTHGLRTTVILEPVQPHDEVESWRHTWKNIESISAERLRYEIACRTPEDLRSFFCMTACPNKRSLRNGRCGVSSRIP
jgi:hypothetical protein